MELGVIKSPEDMPMKEPFIQIDASELSAEARKQLKKIKKLTRRGLLYDKNYVERKKERNDDLSDDSDSEENGLIVQSQSQAAAQGMRSDSFDDEFFDEDFVEADEADNIDVRPVKTIEKILDMRYVEGKAQYFVKWQYQPDCAGEWCYLKGKDPAVKKYQALSAAKKQVSHLSTVCNHMLTTTRSLKSEGNRSTSQSTALQIFVRRRLKWLMERKR